jgi:hypothetical protein
VKKRGAALCFRSRGYFQHRGATIHDGESWKFLGHLRVRNETIIFLGGEFGLPDRALMNYLERFFNLLVERLKGISFDAIYAPAWEQSNPGLRNVASLSFLISEPSLSPFRS